MSQFEKQELAQEALWRKCAKSPEFFFENFWHIQHPEQGAIPFELFDAQQRALDTFVNERYVVTLKARQIGWTTLVAGYAFWIGMFHPDRLVIFLSKGEREAKQILQKVVFGYKRMPEWMRQRNPRTNDNLTEFMFRNGSSIESLPSKSDPARGRTCYLVVVDEWAFLENPEEAWASIEPIADVGGRVIGLSTANGWGNFFYSLYVGAETGVNIFTPIFEPWSARDDRDEDWYEVKTKTLPSWQLHQEYPRNPDEAFIKSGNPFFDVEKLAALEVCDPEEGFLQAGDFVTFVQNNDGPFQMWARPEFGESYVVGADVAEGLDYGDYSSAHVIRWRTREVVACWHGHIPADEFGGVLADIGRFYNDALVGVENNNHGLTTCKYLKDWHKYPNIFYTRSLDERTKRQTNKMGWTTTRKSKPFMLDELSLALREDSIHLADKRTIAELRTFIRDEMGRLHGSPFDDRVMSLAIAYQMLPYCQQHNLSRGRVEYGTLKWWEQTTRQFQPISVIGQHNTRR